MGSDRDQTTLLIGPPHHWCTVMQGIRPVRALQSSFHLGHSTWLPVYSSRPRRLQ